MRAVGVRLEGNLAYISVLRDKTMSSVVLAASQMTFFLRKKTFFAVVRSKTA